MLILPFREFERTRENEEERRTLSCFSVFQLSPEPCSDQVKISSSRRASGDISTQNFRRLHYIGENIKQVLKPIASSFFLFMCTFLAGNGIKIDPSAAM